MQASEREARQQRSMVWHTAALPLMKRFPSAASFIDPKGPDAVKQTDRATRTFLQLRSLDSAPPPNWVLEKFGLPPAQERRA